jgi:hypothetical protein
MLLLIAPTVELHLRHRQSRLSRTLGVDNTSRYHLGRRAGVRYSDRLSPAYPTVMDATAIGISSGFRVVFLCK